MGSSSSAPCGISLSFFEISLSFLWDLFELLVVSPSPSPSRLSRAEFFGEDTQKCQSEGNKNDYCCLCCVSCLPLPELFCYLGPVKKKLPAQKINGKNAKYSLSQVVPSDYLSQQDFGGSPGDLPSSDAHKPVLIPNIIKTHSEPLLNAIKFDLEGLER